MTDFRRLCAGGEPSFYDISEMLDDVEYVQNNIPDIQQGLINILNNWHINMNDKYHLIKKAIKVCPNVLSNDVVYQCVMGFDVNNRIVKLIVDNCASISQEAMNLAVLRYFPYDILTQLLKKLDDKANIHNVMCYFLYHQKNKSDDSRLVIWNVLDIFKGKGAMIFYSIFNDRKMDGWIKPVIYDYVMSSYEMLLCVQNNLIPPELLYEIYKVMTYNNIATIDYTVETSDHDGYCSGSECEYDSYRLNTSFVIPSDIDISVKKWCKYRLKEKHESEMGGGSGYCDLSNESILHNLDLHECRVTIHSIDIKYTDALRWLMDN